VDAAAQGVGHLGEARRLIAASPKISNEVGRSDRIHYNAATRVRFRGARGLGKIHQAGGDGRPICVMHQEGKLEGAEYLGAGPVTCGKCAATRTA
jgi:hypothetical protein